MEPSPWVQSREISRLEKTREGNENTFPYLTELTIETLARDYMPQLTQFVQPMKLNFGTIRDMLVIETLAQGYISHLTQFVQPMNLDLDF